MKNLKLYSLTVILIPILIIALISCTSGSDVIKNNIITKPGAKVLIMMSDGEEYTGELLTIRDSIIILCERHNAREKDLADSVFHLFSLKNRDIRYIEIKGKNNAIYGILFGGLTGAVIGVAAGKSNGKEEEKPDENSFSFDIGMIDGGGVLGCCLGGIFGAMIGGFVAYNITDDDPIYAYVESDEFDFTQLNIYSRYGGKEPEYLKR